MIIYKVFAVLFLPATPFVAQYLVKFFALKRYFDISWKNVAWPLFALELILVSNRFFDNSFLPHYLLLLSAMALFLAVTGFTRIGHRDYFFATFFKNFNRNALPLTLLAYLVTLILCLLQ